VKGRSASRPVPSAAGGADLGVGDLVREFGGSADRALAAARAVAVGAAAKVGYPMLWRQAALAVELCQRGAEMTGQVLPGSYRPGSREDSAARRRTRAD